MKQLWLFVHLLGFTMWLGGGLAAMMIGIASRQTPREALSHVVRLLGVVHRTLIFPGSLAAVISGLAMTLVIYGSPGAALIVGRWLMAMQGFGLAAALLNWVVLLPNVSRLARLDPVAHAAQFDVLRQRQARFGMIAGLLGLLALLAGALGRP